MQYTMMKWSLKVNGNLTSSDCRNAAGADFKRDKNVFEWIQHLLTIIKFKFILAKSCFSLPPPL